MSNWYTKGQYIPNKKSHDEIYQDLKKMERQSNRENNRDRAQMMLNKAQELRSIISDPTCSSKYPTTYKETLKTINILEDEANRLMVEDQDTDPEWREYILGVQKE